MAKFVFDNCCFCVDLRIGCFIIGYFNFIGSAIATILSVILVAGGAVLAKFDPDQRTFGVAVLVVGIINILILTVLLVFDIILLVGLHKRKPGHLKASIIYSCIYLLISLILLIVNLSVGPYDRGDFASRVISLLFNTYFLIMIRSYYYKMLEESATPPQYNS